MQKLLFAFRARLASSSEEADALGPTTLTISLGGWSDAAGFGPIDTPTIHGMEFWRFATIDKRRIATGRPEIRLRRQGRMLPL